MALATPTYLTSSEALSTSNVSTLATGSFTPSANALVIVYIGNTRTVTAAPTSYSISSDTFGAEMGAWTEIASLSFNDGVDRFMGISAWWAIASATPAAGTVTFSWTNSTARNVAAAIEFASGYHATTPVLNSKSGSGTGSTLSLTLDATPASTSAVVGLIASAGDAGGITPGSGYTELREGDSGGTITTTTLESQYDLVSPTTTVNWSDLASDSSGGIGFEVQVPAAVASLTAAAAGVGTTTVAMATRRALAATATGVGTTTASFATGQVYTLTATATGVGTTTVDLRVIRVVAARADGTSTTTVSVIRQAHRAAQADGTSTVTVSLNTRFGRAAQSDGTGTVAVAMAVRRALSATSAGSGAVTLSLSLAAEAAETSGKYAVEHAQAYRDVLAVELGDFATDHARVYADVFEAGV
jgi:hypothetical protein